MQRQVLSAGVNKNFDDDGLPSLCISACRELGNCETGIGEVADDICSADIGILPGSAARRSTITAIVSWLSEDVQRQAAFKLTDELRSRAQRRRTEGGQVTMRLNGWQRIGIVASVIWAIGAPIYLDTAAQRDAMEQFDQTHKACLDNPRNDFDVCFRRASAASDSVPRYHFTSANGAFVALVPLPIAWVIAYALVYLGRWIRAGFKS